MIEVRVSGVSALREIIGKDTVVSLKRGSTVGDLIKVLDGRFGSAYRDIVGETTESSIKKRFSMLVNDTFISPAQNLDKTLNDGDEITFFQLAGA